MEKPTMKQRFESLATFIWDSENSKILGRGGRSWAEIGLFYLVYYACLASFFAATLAVFYETISDTEPKLQADSSLLAGNPGMGFRPMVNLDDPKVKASPKLGDNDDYKDELAKFLKPYTESGETESCSGNFTRPGEKKPCEVIYDDLIKECQPSDEYGFASGNPCVLIKLNKVFGWEPKMWATAPSFISPSWNMTYSPSVVPLRCYAKDSDNTMKLGDIEYYPQQGFPLYYYPYEQQKDYRAPVVFVKFNGAKRGTTHEVECRAYAKNIDYDRTEMQGSVQFKLYISKD